MSVLVFDNTPLSHFARAGALPALESLTAGHRRVVPAEVVGELIAGIALRPAISTAVSLLWLEIIELKEIEEIIAFARYKAAVAPRT